MYKVLIVEDEIFVRLGIKMSVEWEKLGMEVIADVSNGKQALEVYEKEHPEIVLTDIRMPVMDGMELIRSIREKDSETRILILSCLEEFHLVREAISMDVSDYIMKLSMTQEDMEKVLAKVKKELDLIRSRTAAREEMSAEEKQKFLLDFLYYDTYSQEAFLSKMQRLSLPFGKKNLLMAVLEIDSYEDLQKRFRDEYGMLVSSALLNVLSELTQEYGSGMVLEENGKRYILIADHEKMNQKAEAENRFVLFLGRIQKTMKLYFQTSVTIGVSRMADGYENLRALYQQCSYCLEQKFYHRTGERLFYFEIMREDQKAAVDLAMRKLENEGGDDRIRTLAQTGREMFEKSPERETLTRFFKNLVAIEVNQVVMENQKRFSLIGEFVQRMEKAERLDELLEIYRSLKYQLYENPNARNMSRTVLSIIQYVSKNYSQNMPLEQIAEFVELSPNYICSLFKKEMGINLFQYIMEFRIARARELLLSTNLKSYEIAERTGFADESYFSRSFKKVTGQSPGEFRRSVFHREEG